MPEEVGPNRGNWGAAEGGARGIFSEIQLNMPVWGYFGNHFQAIFQKAEGGLGGPLGPPRIRKPLGSWIPSRAEDGNHNARGAKRRGRAAEGGARVVVAIAVSPPCGRLGAGSHGGRPAASPQGLLQDHAGGPTR